MSQMRNLAYLQLLLFIIIIEQLMTKFCHICYEEKEHFKDRCSQCKHAICVECDQTQALMVLSEPNNSDQRRIRCAYCRLQQPLKLTSDNVIWLTSDDCPGHTTNRCGCVWLPKNASVRDAKSAFARRREWLLKPKIWLKT